MLQSSRYRAVQGGDRKKTVERLADTQRSFRTERQGVRRRGPGRRHQGTKGNLEATDRELKLQRRVRDAFFGLCLVISGLERATAGEFGSAAMFHSYWTLILYIVTL